MTSLAPNTIPSAPSSTPQASSNTPSAHSGSQSTSGQSSTIAAATAGSRPTQVLYAQAAKKPSYTPPIVSSTVGSSPSVVGGAPGSNARTSNASPVNGKNQVAPAVPTVTPAMNSVIVNGTSGPSNGHGRKPSAVSGGNGGNAWMHNGNPQASRPQQNNQPSIRFGSFPPDQSMQPVPGSAPISSPNLSAPAVPNPRISSPQMSPSPLPQPAVSGGPIAQGMQNQNIQFGAWGQDRGDQRQMHRPAPMPIPPVPPTSQGPGHMRRESSNSHQQHPEMPQSGMGSNRGGMPGNNRRNQAPPFGGQNTYQHQPQGYNNHNNYNNNRNAPNQSRGGGYQAPINQPHYPNVPGANYQSPRQPPRSPAMHHPLPHTQPVVPHSLPGTPQLGTVQIANSPSFQPANMYPTVQQQLYPPAQQQYDPNMYPHPSYAAHMHGYGQYPGAPPPASPRGQYAALNHPGPYMGINMGYPAPPATMTRSVSSTAPDINRPPSGFGVQHTPMISPTPPINPAFFKKPEKVSRGIKITRPDGTPLNLNAEPPETPKTKPVVVSSSSSPVIVSSGNPPPRPTVTESKKSTAELGGVLALQVQKRIEENEARELELKKAEEEKSKREAKEAEEKKRKEEEERKRREEEEERLRKEAEEKARLEEEERQRKEAEAARIAKEKAEEEARIAKEKEEEEKRLKEEEEKRIREEVERRLREEEEKRRKAEEEERLRKEEEERLLKLKEEEERRLKEAEEKRLKEEQEAKQKAKEDAERLAKEEEERKAREEAKAAAEAAAAAAKSAEALTEDTAQQTKPEPVAQVSSPQPLPAADEATRPTKLRGSKPSPLVIKPSTEPGPPSAALTALRSARFIGDINSVKYPDNILSPNPALNSAAPAGKFKYQKDFLLQFQNVFTEKPSVDWDQIIRDSVGEPTDSARPSASSKMGVGLGGGRSGSRSGATAAQPPIGTMSSMGPMGGFGTGKFGLPPMTSTQRFEQSNRALASNPLAAVGQFRAGPPSISRTNSSQGLPQQGGLPQSPRIRSQRGASKRGNTAGGVAMEKSESKQAEPKPVLTIPVSDVKPLVSSGSGWKPRTVQAAASTGAAPGALSAVAPPVPTEDNRLSPEMVQRKVKAALNKMTPEKFDKISGQILDIASQSKFETDGRTLRQVIQLTFEKATDEAAWSSMYAKFCKVMMESMDPNIKDENIKDVRTGKVVTGGILFRKYLLNRCQEEFQRGWKVNLPPKPEGETDEAAMLSDEYYIAAAAKRRGLGLIQFIGELFKLGMLTERIMQECVKKLVDYEGVPEEAEVESLCKLLRTIGAVLDGSEKSRSSMDAYFDRIQTMVNHPEIQSRLKFMLMDIIDLRKKNWEVKEVDKGPKTLAEIQADVAKAAAEKEAASRANAQRGGRTAGGRGDGRSYSQGGNYGQSDYQRQMAQNTINSEDLRRLKQRNDRNQNSGQTLGPPTMFGPGARGSNPKRGGMGPPSFNRGDDSGPTSRTATPPAGATTSRNSFGVLGDMGSHANDGDANDSISPAPSAASSPPLAKATPVMRSLSGME